MRPLRVLLLGVAALMSCEPSLFAASSGVERNARAEPAQVLAQVPTASREDVSQILTDVASRIAPLSHSAGIRHRIADATFCLPQNVLAILCYAFLELTGGVIAVADGGGVHLVVVSYRLGVSLGTYVFVGKDVLSDRVVAHELGHTAQSYRQGPFYLPAQGLVSFVQAALSLVSPSFARSYLDRWPENEADELGKPLLLPAML